jgi:hypothetical protein
VLVTGAGGISWSADIGWPEAVSRLAEQQSTAKYCVAVLKGHGNRAQIEQGRLAYSTVKANFDGVIAGLITALSEGESPESLPSLETDLQQGASGLKELCKTAATLLPKVSGQRDIIGDIVKSAVEAAVEPVTKALITLYEDRQKENALTRQTIQTQLEAAKWPDFGEVRAVR